MKGTVVGDRSERYRECADQKGCVGHCKDFDFHLEQI